MWRVICTLQFTLISSENCFYPWFILDYLSIAAQAKMTQVHNIFMPANRNYIKRLWIYESHIFELQIKTWVWKWSSHQYHRGYGFKSRTGLNFFRPYFLYCSLVVFITAKMAFILLEKERWSIDFDGDWCSTKDRALEDGMRRSEVGFLMRMQNFSLCPTLVTRQKHLSL